MRHCSWYMMRWMKRDPTYISNNRDARNLIRKYDRDDLMEAILTTYFGKM